MSCSHDALGPVDPRCGLPELQMISDRIARNIIRYVFHYLTGASEIQIRLPARSDARVHIFLTRRHSRAKGEEGRRHRPYGGALRKERWVLPIARGGASRRERRGPACSRGFPQVPYNTVASRIRNLLLIIMLSILTRHSYFSPSPVSPSYPSSRFSVTWSDACDAPLNENRGRANRFTGFDRCNLSM